MKRLTVLAVASEAYPLVKTGGLADVVGALPAALAGEGMDVRTLLPGYPAVLAALRGAGSVLDIPDLLGGPALVLSGNAGGLRLFCIEAPHLYGRTGLPYTGPGGTDWPDNAQRFAALARVGAMLGQGAVPGYAPDLLHLHDWQAGLVPAYFGAGPRPRTVFTIHNLAFQGRFPAALLAPLGLPPGAFTVDGVEYYGGIGMLKAGLRLSDRITTVSPTYALEIQTPEGGMGLDGLLRARRRHLSGILNGIDGAVWDPANDPEIASPYGTGRLRRRARNKAALQARMGLQVDEGALLCGIVSRLTEQKGMDLLLTALPGLIAAGVQLAVLGSGDAVMQSGFAAIAQAHPSLVSVHLGFEEALAHQIQAGADAILMPSRFEPCGLTQLCALRYGAVPLVGRVGGLQDTVIDANVAALDAGVATGVQVWPVDSAGLDAALIRLLRLWENPKAWAQMQRNGMRADVGWAGPARAYGTLFRSLVA